MQKHMAYISRRPGRCPIPYDHNLNLYFCENITFHKCYQCMETLSTIHNNYFLWYICTLLTKASLFQFIQYTVNINSVKSNLDLQMYNKRHAMWTHVRDEVQLIFCYCSHMCLQHSGIPINSKFFTILIHGFLLLLVVVIIIT